MNYEQYKRDILKESDSEALKLSVRLVENSLTDDDKDRLIDIIYMCDPMETVVSGAVERCRECDCKLRKPKWKFCPVCGQAQERRGY